MLENALLTFLTRYLENYWTECRPTFSVDAFWDKDERNVNVWVSGGKRSKVQGHSMTKSPAGVGFQSSTPCVEP